MKRHFGEQTSPDTKLRINNIISTPAFLYGSVVWIMNRKEQKRLEAAQMRFLRPLLGITRQDKQRHLDMNELNQDNIV
jgi:hypothetical protein